MRFAVVYVAGLCLAIIVAGKGIGQTTYTDVTSDYGIETTYNGILPGGGASWVDCDDDGDWDLIVSCGRDCTFTLFRYDALTGFEREPFGPSYTGPEESCAVACADVDDDGDMDMFASSRPGIVRFFRQVDGEYVEETDWGWPEGVRANPYSVSLADYDADGDLDFYVPNHTGPNFFFRNDGGRWTDISAEMGTEDPDGLGFQGVWFDYDNDGDQDIYVANDKGAATGAPNALFRNNGNGTFTDVSRESGANLEGALMGLEVGDYDNDGDLDFYSTNIPDGAGGIPGNVFGRNNGDGTFTEVAREIGVAADLTCWGANFFDADNDGDMDLFVAAMEDEDSDRMYWNNGDGTYTDGTIGSGIEDTDLTFGSTVADYDDDGDLDLYVTNSTGINRLFRNDLATGNWLKIRLRGTESNRDAIGTRAIARDGSRSQLRELQAGNSYLCQDAPELHFGFGDVTVIDELEIRWPNGQIQLLFDVAVNQTLSLVEPMPTDLADALRGSVNTGAGGGPSDVLFVNGTSGGALREVTLSRSDSISVMLASPPSLSRARYVLYALPGVPRTSSLRPLPASVGTMVLPSPIDGAPSIVTLNTLGHPVQLGPSDREGLPLAPFALTKASGIGDEIVFTLQAIVQDDASSSSYGLSTTNAVVLRSR